MIFQILFFIALLAIFIACFVAVRSVTKGSLRPFARNLLISLFVFEVLLAIADVMNYRYAGQIPPFWEWFFDLQDELNLGAIFSAIQLMLVAMVALVISLRTPDLKRWQRGYWLLLTLTFVYLGLDEFYSFHETLGGRVPTEFWRIPYAVAGSVLLLISFGAWWFGFRKHIQTFILMFTGLAVMTISGIAVEEFVLRGFVSVNPSMDWLYVFEEIFEMVGATIVLATFLSFAQEHLDSRGWSFAGRFVTAAGLLWTAWFFFSMLFVPAIEARLFATSVDVDYDNGLLTLVAYRMTPKITDAGGEVEITFYWRANRPLPEDYSLSVHALTHPEVESVAQSDDLNIGPIPSRAWFPNVTMRRSIYVQLPKNLDTPADLWLMARVWWGPWPFLRPWQDTTGLPISRSDLRQQLAFDAVIIDSVAVRPEQELPSSEFATHYSFTSENFDLVGVELPDSVVTSDTLPIKFWWKANADGKTNLTQFVHFVAEGGEQVYGYDQQPFGGSFPTNLWPANMQTVDEWQIPLPEDLPTGSYELYTGLYDLNTLQRSPVVNDGEAVQDNRIFLGTIRYDPALSAVISEEVQDDPANYCYAMGDATPIQNTTEDSLVRINRITGEAENIGFTTTESAEALTFNADASLLYTVDERETGQFGWIDPLTGAFTAVGAGLATQDNPAANSAHGTDILLDVDGITVDPAANRLWAVVQDGKNYLFQIDPDTGEVIRGTFGTGNDYIKIDLSTLTDAPYTNVEDIAIDPRDGIFYVIASSEEYEATLTRIDLDSVNIDTGMVQVVEVGKFVSTVDATILLDMEGLSFHNDGTLYASTTDHAAAEADQESLWLVDPATGQSTPIGKFTDHLDSVDFEGIACGSAAS